MTKAERMRQFRAALKAFVETVTDEKAVLFPSMFDSWKPGETVQPGDRRFYEPTGKLYKVNDGKGHTTQADWTPDKTPALWSVIDVAHAGTVDDPIPAARGMEYTYSAHYLDPEDNNVYVCERGKETGTIVLQYLPHELIGQYFAAV